MFEIYWIFKAQPHQTTAWIKPTITIKNFLINFENEMFHSNPHYEMLFKFKMVFEPIFFHFFPFFYRPSGHLWLYVHDFCILCCLDVMKKNVKKTWNVTLISTVTEVLTKFLPQLGIISKLPEAADELLDFLQKINVTCSVTIRRISIHQNEMNEKVKKKKSLGHAMKNEILDDFPVQSSLT